MDLNEAYEIMGIPESSTREEVEQQYAVWVRKDRAAKRSGPDSDQEVFDFTKVNEAYRTILNHFYELDDKEKPKRSPGIEKLDHFWTYYKFHLFGALLLIGGIIYGINVYLDHKAEQEYLASLPPAAATMMIYGDFYEPNIGDIEMSILNQKPDWERIVVNHTYLPAEITDSYGIALQQKAVVTLVTDRSDVYLIDHGNMQGLVNQGLFQPLDAYEERLKAAVGEANLIYARSEPSGLYDEEEPGETHLYMIKLPPSDQYHTLADEVMAGIHIRSENIENALQMIEVLAGGL